MSSESTQQLQDSLVAFLTPLFKAFLAFLQKDSTFYWPFILSTILIAAIAWRLTARRADGKPLSYREFQRRFLGRALWWHPSARVDYRYYVVNAVIFPLLVGPALLTGVAIANGFDQVLAPFIGPADPKTGASTAMRIAYTIVFFVAYDFGRFLAHSAQHDIPFLWEFHKVHHSAEVLTPFTASRAHPIDLAVMAWGSAITTGFATWAFQRLGGVSISYFTFLQLHVLLWFFNLLGNLKHWQVPISYGRILDRWLISPRHHQIHHSKDPRHFGRNRGFEIALWDRLFGTLYIARKDEELAFGLGDGTDGRWHKVWRLYFWPFGLAGNGAMKAIGFDLSRKKIDSNAAKEAGR